MDANTVDQAAEQVIAAHEATYHPGRPCRENGHGRCVDSASSFAFAKAAPRITAQMRAAGWTTGTVIVVAEPGDTIADLLRRLAAASDGGRRVLLAVADPGQPGRWQLTMMDTPTAVDYPATGAQP